MKPTNAYTQLALMCMDVVVNMTVNTAMLSLYCHFEVCGVRRNRELQTSGKSKILSAGFQKAQSSVWVA